MFNVCMNAVEAYVYARQVGSQCHMQTHTVGSPVTSTELSGEERCKPCCDHKPARPGTVAIYPPFLHIYNAVVEGTPHLREKYNF